MVFPKNECTCPSYEWTLTTKEARSPLISECDTYYMFLGKQTKIVPLCTFATYHNCFIFWHNSLEIIATTLVYRGWKMRQKRLELLLVLVLASGQESLGLDLVRNEVVTTTSGSTELVCEVSSMVDQCKFYTWEPCFVRKNLPQPNLIISVVCFRPSGDLVCWNDENPGCNADLSGIKQTVDSPDWNTLCKVPTDHRHIFERKCMYYYPFIK